MVKVLRIAGIAISISWVGLLTLGVWIEALRVKYGDFFATNVNTILVVSSILLFLLVILGGISLKALLRGAKEVGPGG